MTDTTPGGADPVDVGLETPEADAVEQAQTDDSVVATPRAVRHIPDDVPEADALEQAYEVDLSEDYPGG